MVEMRGVYAGGDVGGGVMLVCGCRWEGPGY